MPVVKIVAGEKGPNRIALGWGTKLFIDGQMVDDVRDINLHFGTDELVQCDVKLHVCEPFDFEAPAGVTYFIDGACLKMRRLLASTYRGHKRWCVLLLKMGWSQCECGALDWNARLDEVLNDG